MVNDFEIHVPEDPPEAYVRGLMRGTSHWTMSPYEFDRDEGFLDHDCAFCGAVLDYDEWPDGGQPQDDCEFCGATYVQRYSRWRKFQ